MKSWDDAICDLVRLHYVEEEGAAHTRLIINDEITQCFFGACNITDIRPGDGFYAVITRYTRTSLIEGRWQTTVRTCVHVCILAYTFDVCVAKAVIIGAPHEVEVECIQASRNIIAEFGTCPMFRVMFRGPDGSRQYAVTTARMENDTVHLVQYAGGGTLAESAWGYLTVANGANIEVRKRPREVIRVTEFQMQGHIIASFELSFGGAVCVHIPMGGALRLQKVGKMHSVEVYLVYSERRFVVGIDCNETLCCFCHELHDPEDAIQVQDGVLFRELPDGNLLQAKFRPNPESMILDCIWTRCYH